MATWASSERRRRPVNPLHSRNPPQGMRRRGPFCLALAASVLLGLAGCTGPSTMTDQQKEAYELRRYCEKNPEDVVRCLGFLGFH